LKPPKKKSSPTVEVDIDGKAKAPKGKGDIDIDGKAKAPRKG